MLEKLIRMIPDNTLTERVGSYTVRSPRTIRLAKYILVGFLGLLLNESLLFLTTGVLGASYLLGGVVGRVVSTSVNYLINDRWTWSDYGDSSSSSFAIRGVKYGLTRLVGIGIGLTALYIFVEYVGLHYLIANLFAVGVGLLWGFGTSDFWVWRTDEVPYIQNWISTIRSKIDRGTKYVLIVTAVLFALFAGYTSLLYIGYWSTGGDLGAYVHMFTTTLDGQGFLHHGKYRVSHPQESYWGAHFTITLLAFLPVYAVFQSPITLLVIKAAVVSISIPVFWLVARSYLSNDHLAGLLTASYAFNPFLWGAWIYDFQEQIFLPLFIFGAYHYYEQKRWTFALGFVLLALFTNEFVVLLIFGFAVALLIDAYRKDQLMDHMLPIAAIVGMSVATHIIAGIVIGRFSEISGIPRWAIAEPYHPFMGSYRTGIGELLGILIANPQLIAEVLTHNALDKTAFLVLLFVPVLFVALTDEITLGTLAPFVGFAWLFAGTHNYFTFGAHYPFYLLPFIYIGTLRAFGRIQSLDHLTLPFLKRAAVVILVLNMALAGAMVTNTKAFPRIDGHTATLDQSLEEIPHDADLVTQNTIYPHVADRPNAHYVAHADRFERYQEQHGTVTPEYILFDTELNTRHADWAGQTIEAFGSRLGNEYKLYRYEDGIWIFKHGYEGNPEGIGSPYQFEPMEIDATEMSVIEGEMIDEQIIGQGGEDSETIWFGPYEMLPPGEYAATFLVNVTADHSSSSEPVVALDVATGKEHTVVEEQKVTETDGWKAITLHFTLEETTRDVEFRGRQAGGEGKVRLKQTTLNHFPDSETSGSDQTENDSMQEGGS